MDRRPAAPLGRGLEHQEKEGAVMFARSTTIMGEPEKLEAGIIGNGQIAPRFGATLDQGKHPLLANVPTNLLHLRHVHRQVVDRYLIHEQSSSENLDVH